MQCHECARDGREQAAAAQCRFCLVGLCTPHLVASFMGATVPQYGCAHHRERPFAAQESVARVRPALVATSAR
jgi:Uncharacterized protein conserved in archaea (DUF2180).